MLPTVFIMILLNSVTVIGILTFAIANAYQYETNPMTLNEIVSLAAHFNISAFSNIQSYNIHQKFIRSAMIHATRELYNTRISADNEYNETKPYIHLEGHQRSVIIPENKLTLLDSCVNTCEEHVDCDELTSLDDRKDWCSGGLHDCKTLIDSSVCEAPKGSARLYEWYKYEDYFKYYGKVNSSKLCSGTIKHYSGHRSWLYYCDQCICTCTNGMNGYKRYAFSLASEISNISNNEVVIGIRFQMKDNVIFPQIKTGIIMPEGRIKDMSQKWKPFERKMRKIRFGKRFYEVPDTIQIGRHPSKPHRISLDDIDVGDKVITGVKFSVIQDPLGFQTKVDKHDRKDVISTILIINLEVRATQYNFTTGELGTSTWETPKYRKSRDSNSKRTKVHLYQADDPSLYPINSPNSFDGQFIEFQPSDLKKDVGQTTVPFIDALPIVSDNIPLSGIGLFHNSAPGSGGYISFKITVYNLLKHLKWN